MSLNQRVQDSNPCTPTNETNYLSYNLVSRSIAGSSPGHHVSGTDELTLACLSPALISPVAPTTAPSCSSTLSPPCQSSSAPAAGPVAPAVQLDRAAPRRPRPPGLRSERPRRRCGGTSPENTAACRRLPDRRRSPAHPLGQGDRLVIGKSWLIQRLGTAMRSGDLTVAEHAPGRDLLRQELAQFVFKPGERGRLRLEAARGHDDLVIAAALGARSSSSRC